MDWYYAKNGQQNGPVETETLAQLYQSGQIAASDLVWNDTLADWAPIGTLQEFSAGEDASKESAPPPVTPPTGPTAGAAATTTRHLSPVQHDGEKIPTYLWQSIVAILFCCWIPAIVSLVFATKVNPAIEAGDIAAAKHASHNAKIWFWVAVGLGILLYGIIIVFSAIGAIAEQSNL